MRLYQGDNKQTTTTTIIIYANLYSINETRTGRFKYQSNQPGSVQDGIHALAKAHMRYTRYLGSFPNVAKAVAEARTQNNCSISQTNKQITGGIGRVQGLWTGFTTRVICMPRHTRQHFFFFFIYIFLKFSLTTVRGISPYTTPCG